MGQDKPFF